MTDPNHIRALTVVGVLLGAADGDELGTALGAKLGVTVGAPVGGCERREEEGVMGEY